MSFIHKGVSFFFPRLLESQLFLFNNRDNLMKYSDTFGVPGIDLYSNEINYYIYNPDVNNSGLNLQELGWNLAKISTPHIIDYPGEEDTFAQKVFGVPIAFYNTEATQVVFLLKMTHSSTIDVVVKSLDVASDTMVLRVTNGTMTDRVGNTVAITTSIIDEKMILSRQNNLYSGGEFIDGIATINGTGSPQIEVGVTMVEYKCTVIDAVTISGISEIEVHIDDEYDEYEIVDIVNMSPDNQELMILPLGNGIFVPKLDDTTDTGSVSGDTFPDTIGQHGLESWVYNQESMSSRSAMSSSVMKFVLEPNEVYKFMTIVWKSDGLSFFSNGLHTRLFN